MSQVMNNKIYIRRNNYDYLSQIEMRLLGTKGYNRVFPRFFLSTLGRAHGNNMKYLNTLWGIAETSFRYPCKGFLKSS